MMRRLNIYVLSIAIVISLIASCSKGDTTKKENDMKSVSSNSNTSNQKREMSINFTLSDLYGNSFTLHDNKNKVIVMDFWATSCGPCRLEIPKLIELNSKYKDKGVLFVGVGLDSKERLADFSKQYKINYDILIGSQEVAGKYGIKYIPTTYILDKKGRIIKKLIGYQSGKTEDQIEKAIDEALKE